MTLFNDSVNSTNHMTSDLFKSVSDFNVTFTSLSVILTATLKPTVLLIIFIIIIIKVIIPVKNSIKTTTLIIMYQ